MEHFRNAFYALASQGGAPEAEPDATEIVGSSIDEDYTPTAESLQRERDEEDSRDSKDIAEGPRYDGPDFGDESDSSGAIATADDDLDDEILDAPVEPTHQSLCLPTDVACRCSRRTGAIQTGHHSSSSEWLGRIQPRQPAANHRRSPPIRAAIDRAAIIRAGNLFVA